MLVRTKRAIIRLGKFLPVAFGLLAAGCQSVKTSDLTKFTYGASTQSQVNKLLGKPYNHFEFVLDGNHYWFEVPYLNNGGVWLGVTFENGRLLGITQYPAVDYRRCMVLFTNSSESTHDCLKAFVNLVSEKRLNPDELIRKDERSGTPPAATLLEAATYDVMSGGLLLDLVAVETPVALVTEISRNKVLAAFKDRVGRSITSLPRPITSYPRFYRFDGNPKHTMIIGTIAGPVLAVGVENGIIEWVDYGTGGFSCKHERCFLHPYNTMAEAKAARRKAIARERSMPGPARPGKKPKCLQNDNVTECIKLPPLPGLDAQNGTNTP